MMRSKRSRSMNRTATLTKYTTAVLAALLALATTACDRMMPMMPKPATGQPEPLVSWRSVAASSAAGKELRGVAWSRSLARFVAVGRDADGSGVIMYSSDGTSWTDADSGADAVLNGVAWNGTRFVAVGRHDTPNLHSTDGMNWTAVTARGAVETLNGVTSNGSGFVAVGGAANSSAIVRSADGTAWEPAGSVSVSNPKALYGVTWNGTRFVAVGVGGIILHSTDGDIWEPATSSGSVTTGFLDAVAGNSRFVAVGFGGDVLHSVDGDTWERSSDADRRFLYAVAWAASAARFVAVGERGTIVYSADGDTWVTATTPPDTHATLRAVTGNGSLFVAVGDGAIMVSP